MLRIRPILFTAATVAASWLGMTALHELGHVLHAYASGGRVTAVELPPRGLGHTQVSPNPHPQFVAWGGACWGSLLGCAPMVFARRGELGGWLARFFAGTCLTANGVYLGLGGLFGDPNGADDAHELLRYGAPGWQLALMGSLATATGLAIWHRLGPRLGLRSAVEQAGWLSVTTLIMLAGALLCAGLSI